MFQLNYNLIRNMGWKEYSFHRGISKIFPESSISEEDWDVKFFLLFEDKRICYLVKENKLSDKLQNSEGYNKYKFVKVHFSKKKLKTTTDFICSNLELMSILRENLACNKTYQRFFQINSIIK